MKIQIDKLGDYAGLPVRFLLRSEHGWLADDGFSRNPHKARIFRTEADALAYFNKLFPQQQESAYGQ